MSPKTLRFLVVSDLHAHANDPKVGASYCSTDATFSDSTDNPLTGVADLLSQAGASPDWIVCPGDLGDRADAVAQKHAWEELERIRVAVGASALIGAVGNHDVDSHRKRVDHDPKGTLQRLSPEFPVRMSRYEEGDHVYVDRHWSRNYVTIQFPEFDCRLLLINSCGFHGFASEEGKSADEHLHGRLSPMTLASIRNEIETRRARLNIVLVHHHPRPNPWIEDGGSVMLGGEKLIEALKSTEQQWIVVHGHQHVPHLAYADASPFAPVVLSSASVAAKTYPVKGGYPRNQIHMVEVPVERLDPSGEEVLGTVTSWSWAAQLGWLPAQSGLPPRGGPSRMLVEGWSGC